MPINLSALVNSASLVVPGAVDLVRLVAKRAKQLGEGQPDLLEPGKKTAGMTDYEVALQEVVDGKLAPESTGEDLAIQQMRQTVDRIAAERLPSLARG